MTAVLMSSDRQLRRSHRSQAASLRAVTRLVAKNHGLTDLINFHFDAEDSPPPDSEDAEWIKSLDLARCVVLFLSTLQSHVTHVFAAATTSTRAPYQNPPSNSLLTSRLIQNSIDPRQTLLSPWLPSPAPFHVQGSRIQSRLLTRPPPPNP